ncbi:MAG: hypothetical protein HRU19_09485 [Pseudobacteriovorax sp.]|nr:hypothetical protein [Pseudobacteriovorax sp.]
MFGEWFGLLIHDAKAIILGFEMRDLAHPSYLMLWLVILFYPLHGVDRNDPIAGLVYVLYSLFVGTTVFFALPKNFQEISDLNTHFGILVIMGCVTAYRWWFHTNEPKKVVAKAETHENKGDFR